MGQYHIVYCIAIIVICDLILVKDNSYGKVGKKIIVRNWSAQSRLPEILQCS